MTEFNQLETEFNNLISEATDHEKEKWDELEQDPESNIVALKELVSQLIHRVWRQGDYGALHRSKLGQYEYKELLGSYSVKESKLKKELEADPFNDAKQKEYNAALVISQKLVHIIMQMKP